MNHSYWIQSTYKQGKYALKKFNRKNALNEAHANMSHAAFGSIAWFTLSASSRWAVFP